MAERKLLYIDLTEEDVREIEPTDTITLGGATLSGDLDLTSSGKVVNANAATVAGDALVYGQSSGELADLTIASTGNVTLSGGGELLGLPATPSGDTAATSKAYVDAVAQNLDPKDSVRAATTAAGTLASDFENGDAIDNVTLATGNRILIKNQAVASENGIYIVAASGAPTRASDLDTGANAASAFVFVEEGDVNADSGWTCTNDQGSDVVGTDGLTWVQFSGAGQITAGDGMSKTGNTLDVGAGNGIAVAADTVAVNPDTATASTASANAILAAANGVGIAVDDSTIEGSLAGSAGAETLRVKDGGITNAKIDPNINFSTTGTITADGNITTTAGVFTGDGSGLTNLPSAGVSEAITISAKKSTAGTLSVGQVVHLVGYSAPDYTVELADADTAALMPAIGIVTATVTDAAAGSVVVYGKASGIDTSSFSAGDRLYVSTTAGALTATKPTGAANAIQAIGEVALSAVSGIIQVTGAGRSNDLPNIAQNNIWAGNASDVPTSTPAGDGIAITAGSEIQVDIVADQGLHFQSGQLNIELDNTPDTLDADSNGLKVVGLPSQFKVNDTQVSANVTAANLDTLVAGSGSDASALHFHPASTATDAPKLQNTLTTATDATSNGDAVHINGNNTVGLARADTASKMDVIGVIESGSGVAGSTPTVISHGPCASVLTAATAGDKYYVQSTGGIGTGLPAANETIFRVGYARNATDLWVHMRRIGRRAAS